MLIRFTSIVSCISLLATSVHAYGMVAQVVDENNFCVFLPPDDSPNRIISDSEWNANAFCIGDTPLAKDAGTLPTGFIQSAHYVKTDAYVQVTGQIDGSKADLDSTDGGGQMDIKAPDGSSCAGWSYYVNLIEPETNTYCMRCCNDSKSCNRGISEKGCAHIIPGDYSGPIEGAEPSVSESSSADSISTTTHVAVVSGANPTTPTETDDAVSSVTSEAVTSVTSESVTSESVTSESVTSESVTSESVSSVTNEPVSVSADAIGSSTTLPQISSPVALSSVTSSESASTTQNTADSMPTEDTTIQSVSGANTNSPTTKAVIGASLFAFVITFI